MVVRVEVLRLRGVSFPLPTISKFWGDKILKGGKDITVVFPIPETSKRGVLARDWETVARIADHHPKRFVLLTKPESVAELEKLIKQTWKVVMGDDRI